MEIIEGLTKPRYIVHMYGNVMTECPVQLLYTNKNVFKSVKVTRDKERFRNSCTLMG
jgi:hypothetical protein